MGRLGTETVKSYPEDQSIYDGQVSKKGRKKDDTLRSS